RHVRCERRAGRVLAVAAAARRVRRRQVLHVVAVHTGTRRTSLVDVHRAAVDEDALPGREVYVDLAVLDGARLERREPHDELPVAGTSRLIADVGGEDA